MKAVCWHGANDVRVETVPDPKILNPHDAILKVTSTTICGSDLHLYDGYIPTMQPGDILGHEFMGEIVETGSEVKRLQKGDRAIVSSMIGCGHCFFCTQQMWSLCDNTNPNAWMQEKLFGFGTSGIFGYSHLFGGYAGGDAEYVRVPFADFGALKDFAKAETINYEEVDAGEALREMTGGRGPDACIDAVGMEAHAIGLEDVYDQTKQKLKLESDRPMCCGK